MYLYLYLERAWRWQCGALAGKVFLQVAFKLSLTRPAHWSLYPARGWSRKWSDLGSGGISTGLSWQGSGFGVRWIFIKLSLTLAPTRTLAPQTLDDARELVFYFQILLTSWQWHPWVHGLFRNKRRSHKTWNWIVTSVHKLKRCFCVRARRSEQRHWLFPIFVSALPAAAAHLPYFLCIYFLHAHCFICPPTSLVLFLHLSI